jgi:hypothetical protein
LAEAAAAKACEAAVVAAISFIADSVSRLNSDFWGFKSRLELEVKDSIELDELLFRFCFGETREGLGATVGALGGAYFGIYV